MHSINEALKAQRIASNMSPEHIATALNIKPKYIIAIEENNYELISSKVYIEGYVRLYADFLGIAFVKPQFQNLAVDSQIAASKVVRSPKFYNIYLITIMLVALITITFTYYLSHYSTTLFEKSNSDMLHYIELANKSLTIDDYMNKISNNLFSKQNFLEELINDSIMQENILLTSQIIEKAPIDDDSHE